MLGAVVRRGSGLKSNFLPWSLPVAASRSKAVVDCSSSSSSSPRSNEVVRSLAEQRFDGGSLGSNRSVDRSTESGVLGFGSQVVSNLFARCGREQLIYSPMQGLSGALISNWSHSGPTQSNQVRGFIQLKTNLEVADNSGAKRVQCIKVMKGSNAAEIGDIIMASVKDAQPRGKVKKGEVVTCVVVRAATQKLRRDGSEIKFDKSAVVLVNKQGEPIGTRIFGPVPHELRRRKLVKILTLAEYVA